MPNELVISSLPNRSGLYLCTQEGSRIVPVARFTHGEASAKIFVAWAVKAGARYEGKGDAATWPTSDEPPRSQEASQEPPQASQSESGRKGSDGS